MRNYIRQILVDSLDREEIEDRRLENERKFREAEEARMEEEVRNRRYDSLQTVIDAGQFNSDGNGIVKTVVILLITIAVISLILSAVFGN